MPMRVIRGPLSFISVGLIVSILLFGSYRNISELWYLNSPVSTIYESAVFVPDFKLRENVLVLYNSEKHVEFNGDFTVEVKTLGDNSVICRGSGTNITYSPTDELNNDMTTFDWYVGGPCSALLTKGRFYLETNYRIRVEGQPVRYLKTLSNVFNVT